MSNSIVTVNVSLQVAPTPPTLQQTGALISQGATTTAQGTKSFLTQASDLTTLLKGALAISSITWLSSVATVTTAAPHGFTISDTIPLTISGATPAGYNGTFTCTITGASSFTYPLASNPGSESIPGVYTLEDVSELLAMVATFFAQGTQQGVYVLELGAGNSADGVTYLTTWIAANPGFFYSYLMPRSWSDESTFYGSFVAGFEASTSKTYFYVTMEDDNYTNFTPLMKCVKGLIEAPSGLPALEFTHAADFRHDLAYAPSSTNKVTPNAFCFLFGVTPFPTVGNAAKLAAYKAAGVNVVDTGAEGGITNTILKWGTTMDGNDFTYWYSVDWVQINADLTLSNVVEQGSNNPVNPVNYNQDGINRLQSALAAMAANGVSFGLILGVPTQVELIGTDLASAIDAGTFSNQTIVNAVPFIPYSQQNPGDYKIGRYAGLSLVYVPARGFTAIVFNVVVSNFVAQ